MSSDPFDLNCTGLGKKEIVCSRCGKHKLVDSNWRWTECEYCHSRPHSVRSGKKSMKKAEQEMTEEAIRKMVGFEEAYKQHKKDMKELSIKPMNKKEFWEKWSTTNQAKKEKLKRAIEKYSGDIPINDVECLHFRYLLEKRNQLGYDPSESEKDFACLYFHYIQCDLCARWYQIHKDNALVIPSTQPEGDSEGVSQKEHDQALDDFFKELRGEPDSIEQAERRLHPNLKEDSEATRMIRQDMGLEKPEQPQIDPQRLIGQQDDPHARQQLEREAEEEAERIRNMNRRKLREWLRGEEQ